MITLALDIGGTKFAAAHITPDGALLAHAERPIGPDPAATLGDLVADFAVPGLTAVGIGSAGPLNVLAGTVSPVNIPAWRGFPLVDTVYRATDLPVFLAGDAQCMAAGEWWLGGHDVSSLLGIVVSTGIGGGLVLNGDPLLGATGNAGHIGHVIIDRDGEPCPCGARGCLETIASGPSMVRWARAHGWNGQTAFDLAAGARSGHITALSAFNRAADALATAICNTAAVLDVHDVVIGGGVAATGDLLLSPLRRALATRAGMDFLQDITVTGTTLGRNAGLYGAAALALQTEGAPPATRSRPAVDAVEESVAAGGLQGLVSDEPPVVEHDDAIAAGGDLRVVRLAQPQQQVGASKTG
ncbi:ROK family protein [Actinomadura barringtoniae]|uniref:ROK family protein n=1 Tax=Actinomadura barringtoniae TaxID=1427535 RepID=A0A939PAC3_9ACTN|nr:ROK family protein [Actinomadura barringtoniae]MBO2446328.1 ROK family protein [Actinomadura barringtoniae]